MGVNELKTKAINPTDCVFGVTMDGQLYHEPLSSMVHVLVAGTTGCHAKGELILMANGTSKPVELINGGDKIMGGDGTPRTVLCPRHGFDTMYGVITTDGYSFTANGNHRLKLYDSKEKTYVSCTINELLSFSKTKRERYLLYHPTKLVQFENDDQSIMIDPYILGLFIGNGGTHGTESGCPNITTADKEIVDAIYDYAKKINCTIRVETKKGNKASTYYFKHDPNNYETRGRSKVNNFTGMIRELGLCGVSCGDKFIPDVYKRSSVETRRQVLAGLIDSDGYVYNDNKSIDFVTKSKQLADDIVFVAQSLGIRVSIPKESKKGIKERNFVGTYWRIHMGGAEVIPTKIERKHINPRDKESSFRNNTTKFLIEKISDYQEYFGFTCDGDHSYLLTSGMLSSENSGKSVCLNSYLISMMAHATPNEMRLFIIDPKKVEFSKYKGLPYCPVDPVTDMRDAYGLLAFSVWEMERRYKVLESVGVKQLSEFNEFCDKNPDNPVVKREGKMPYFVFVIDEYADLMDSMKKDSIALETLCSRLAQKGRASGIILILATQRPSADIVTPKLRSNFPSRICLTVADSISSSIALGDAGNGYDGSKLKGKGDGYVLSFDTKKVTRCQSLFISNEEIDAVFDYIRNKYKSKEDYYKKYVPDAVYDCLSDESKKLVEKCGGVVNYKVLTTDKEACNFVDNRTPFCSWVKGEDPETFPDDPKKWHVAIYKESRMGMF